jgi:hypothetical protein
VDDIELLLRQLDVKNGSIQANAKNVRLISQIKQRIEKLVLRDPKYKKNLQEYLNSFKDITKLQNAYFEEIAKEYTVPKLLSAIREEAVSSTYDSLTKAGISEAISKPIQDILRVNITSGAKYSDMLGVIRNFITSSDSGLGALEKYVKQITTDALNQYAAQFTGLVTDDLGLEWFQYTGAIIETSRPFCQALHEKRYIHKSEIPDIITGDFPEFDDFDGKINPNTDLPYGMIDGTNEQNFFVYRGGYNCGHQLVPVNELVVPEEIRNEFSSTPAQSGK